VQGNQLQVKWTASVVLCTGAETSSTAVQSMKLLWELLLMTENDAKKNASKWNQLTSIRGPLWALPMCFLLSAAGADADRTGSQLCGSQREQQEVLPTWWWLLASAARDWCSLAIRSQFDQRLSLCMYSPCVPSCKLVQLIYYSVYNNSCTCISLNICMYIVIMMSTKRYYSTSSHKIKFLASLAGHFVRTRLTVATEHSGSRITVCMEPD